MSKNQKNRRWKYGAAATVITVLGIVVVLAANLVMDQLTERYGWSIDLTENDRYAISDETAEYLTGLSADVSIYVMQEQTAMETGSSYVVQAYQTLQEYARHTPRISLEFIDLVNNPTFASRYPELNLSTWDILVEAGERQEVLALSECYDYSESGYQITASRVEQKLTGAILSVTSEEKTRVTVLTGYGEAEPQELIELLEANQFEVVQQSLVTETPDPEAESAILFVPQSDLEADSLKKLDAWLENDGEQGRNLFVFLDPNYPDLPNLTEFLNEWGIAVEDGYAFEANSNLYYDKYYYPIAQYADMTYAADMTSSDLTVMALCRPVDVLFESKDNYTTTVLLSFTQTSGILPLEAEEVKPEYVTGDVKGMVMSSHSWYGTEVTTSRVVVSGSALAFGSALLTGGTFANADYILGLFRTLNEQAAEVTIVPKDMTAPTHAMTGAQTNAFVWIFMILLPLLVLILGVVVWLRRKNR